MKTVSALLPEDVQSYPRPPSLEQVAMEVLVVLGGVEIVRTRAALRICETHHAPTYYIPPGDITAQMLTAEGTSICEWKGRARYWTLSAAGKTRERAAWSYPQPTRAYLPLKDHLAIYPGLMDACYVGGAEVTPQPGDFYGGWVTPNLTGTVKGAPDTRWW